MSLGGPTAGQGVLGMCPQRSLGSRLCTEEPPCSPCRTDQTGSSCLALTAPCHKPEEEALSKHVPPLLTTPAELLGRKQKAEPFPLEVDPAALIHIAKWAHVRVIPATQ